MAEEMKKADIILALQAKGIDVNPNATKEVLSKMLADSNVGQMIAQPAAPLTNTPVPPTEAPTEMSQLMGMMGTLIKKVEDIDSEVKRMKEGGVNDFKKGAKPEDVAAAESMNSKLDPRIAKIIENTLGIDFAADTTTFSDKPGLLLNIHVPKRLSTVPVDFRPIKDEETGKYKVDPKTGNNIEEEYWRGDTRSVALGSTDSFDVIQQHCNRVRSKIMADYQKLNKPQPEFRTR